MKISQLLFFPLSLLLLTACGGKEEAVIEKRVRAVRSAEIAVSDGTSDRTFSGVTNAAGATPLSFRVSGTLRDVKVKLGNRVRRGQLIATIDPSDLAVQSSQASAQREASAAQVTSAETQLVAARTAYERTSRLYENNSVSLSDFEQARSQFQNAKAQVDAAKSQLAASGAQLRAAGNQVSYTRLTAPFSGIITSVDIERNEYVGSGKAVVTLSTEEDPEVKINLPEGVIGRVKTGMKVMVNLPAVPGAEFHGTVSEVAYASAGSPSYPVMVKIDDQTDAVRPGMAAGVTFTFSENGNAERTAKLLAPVESISEGPNGKYVFKLMKNANGDNYVAKRSPVNIGSLENGGFVVKTGLAEGDRVATAGLTQLLDGMEVRLLK